MRCVSELERKKPDPQTNVYGLAWLGLALQCFGVQLDYVPLGLRLHLESQAMVSYFKFNKVQRVSERYAERLDDVLRDSEVTSWAQKFIYNKLQNMLRFNFGLQLDQLRR